MTSILVIAKAVLSDVSLPISTVGPLAKKQASEELVGNGGHLSVGVR